MAARTAYSGAPRTQAPAFSGACLEHRVDLRAVLYDFPRTDEAGGDHERVPGSEAAALAGGALDGDAPGRHHAQLVLGVPHTPNSTTRTPDAGEQILAGQGQEIHDRNIGRPAEQ